MSFANKVLSTKTADCYLEDEDNILVVGDDSSGLHVPHLCLHFRYCGGVITIMPIST